MTKNTDDHLSKIHMQGVHIELASTGGTVGDDAGVTGADGTFTTAATLNDGAAELTKANKPNPATPNVYRHLGIILDNRLLSAPRIQETISDRGMISGGTMTQEEVQHIVGILDAGSLLGAAAHAG